jgi:hypothetical protein
LNLLRALGRLDEDEAENLATRKRDLRTIRDFRESGLHVIVSGFDLGRLLFGDEIFRVIVADLPIPIRNTRSSTNSTSGNFVLST